MSFWADSAGSRQIDIIADSWLTATVLGNGDDGWRDDGSQGRAYLATDTGAGVTDAYLPQWGVTDWTMGFMLSRAANLNPSGFANYRSFSLTDSSYNNGTLYLRSSTQTAMRLVIPGSPSDLDVTVPADGQLWVIRVQSSDLISGLYQIWQSGRPTSQPVAHGKTAAPVYPGGLDRFQLGGKFGASDFGMLGGVGISKLFVVHDYLDDATIRALATEMADYA